MIHGYAGNISRRAALAGLALAPAMLNAQSMDVIQSDSSLVLASGRTMPFTLWRPKGDGPLPLMLFSHGANSQPGKYANLAGPLAAAGFVVTAPLHADSPDHPGAGKIDPALSMGLRMEDVRGLIGQRQSLGANDSPVVAAGHSYGALIAQILIGARVMASGTQAAAEDAACDCALAFSPPGPFPPNIPDTTWQSINKPMFVQTGTADILPMIAPQWQAHKRSFDTTPSPALLYVGPGVDHYFGNLIGRPERSEPPKTAELARAVALALAFVEHVRSGRSLADLAGVDTEAR
jgi:dienelactone hydrolase